MSHTFDYDRRIVSEALNAVGLKAGDIVFCHSNIGYFGIPDGLPTKEGACQLLLQAFREVIGRNGTLVVPTFTYSFPNGEVFDLELSPSRCGVFSEMIRQLPESFRSWDPIFSVAAIGASAQSLTENVPEECFGPGSFWDRFYRYGGKVCNLNFDAASTFIHYVEKALSVPYRQDRVFPGTFMQGSVQRQGKAIFFSRDLEDQNAFPAFELFHKAAIEKGVAHMASVGRGAVVGISAQDTFKLIEETLPLRPDFLIKKS